MKSIRPIVAPWLLSALLASFLATPQGHAVDRTWTGAGNNDNWNTDANWGGTAPTIYGADGMVFSGSNRLNAVNNITNGIFNKIIFGVDAGPFVLSGNSISLAGDVTNNSKNLQTISLAMTMTANRSFYVNGGELNIGGVISENAAGRTLTKYGLGTLTLSGSNTYTGATTLVAGRVNVDMNAGGQIATPLLFGLATGYDTFNNGVFGVTGKASGSTTATSGALALYNRAASTVVVDSNGGSGTALTFASLSRNGESTLNFKLSSDSSVAFTTAPTQTNGVLLYSTVTSGGTTGFATINGSNQVVRLVPTVDFAPDSTNITLNYKTQGNLAVSLQRTMNTLTITGAGEMSGAGAIQPDAILMQEGAGDYTFKSPRVGSVKQLLIHQYSTVGTLKIEGQLLNDNQAQGLAKAGPGKLHLTGTSTYIGRTYLQGGELQLDGLLSKTAGVTVFDGATLSGTGSLGSGSNLSAVLVRAGGTLRGSQAGGLNITGSLNMESFSNFAMTLGSTGSGTVQVSGAITLGDDVNLILTLGSVPAPDWEVILLQGSSIPKGFATVNGMELGPDNLFSLTYSSNSYSFELFQTGSEIGFRAVPEPSLVALLGVGAAFVLARRRRR